MSILVLVAYAEGEKDLAEQVGEPIRQAGYRVECGTDPRMLEHHPADIVVVCGTAKALENGHTSSVLDSWSKLQGVLIFFAQMEKDLFLQGYTSKDIFHFWLNPASAAQQLVYALKRAIPPQGRVEGSFRDQIFVSYSRKDAKWLNRLQIHLKPLERPGTIVRWDDTCIDPGSKWKTRIREAISRAKVAVLLVSADFLASDFITSNELPPLLVAAETEGAVIIPVIISPCRFEQTEVLSQFQSINPPSQPLIKVTKGRQEEIFVRITEAIIKALRKEN